MVWYGELGVFVRTVCGIDLLFTNCFIRCTLCCKFGIRFRMGAFFNRKGLLVIRATRIHPVPSRTRKLSSLAPMVLGG